ncbi:unnamed protein product [Peronospora destructor]|uniref:PHD-type domain-containing protein n=1 Tax=Peronospora destructor TaxID=86335 RepID=A0AAV0UQU4_9STRA|nr:unnamed protein product [Peronospora destructor]
MTKERISFAELAQRKEEYYELLETSDSSLRDVLNQRGGLVLARVGRYQPWPARFSEPGEFAKMARYRAKKGQACVYFFGSRNYGWVTKSSIQPFPDDLTTLTASNKYNQALIEEALDEAKLVMDVTDDTGRRFFDRILERKNEVVDLPCERCNRVDDHYSLLILCDGKKCKREYHMNCLIPPLVAVPPGEWFCPDCEKDREKEREKHELKRAKADAMDKHDMTSSATGMNGVDGTLLSAKLPSTKKPKKQNYNKAKDGTMKRHLGSASPDRPSVSIKKPRARRSSSREVSPPPGKDFTLSKKLDGRKKKPSQILIPSSRAQLLSDPEFITADEEQRSEEKCLLCSFGGELIVCEFPGCTKVYHQFCLGAYPFPKDENATWCCPRHTCALTGEKETCDDGEKSTSKLKHASPRKSSIKNCLWKCILCPLAISDEALPQVPQGNLFSKKSRTFICPYCFHTPPKIQLAKRLEKVWSTMATNRQGMPFCGPLLCGVEPVDGQLEGRRSQLDLFKVLARIRRLDYEESVSFSRDIDEVVANAVDLIANRSFPLMEAAKTLTIIRNEQFAIHQQKLIFLDSKIRRLRTDRENKNDDKDDYIKSWPLRWRQECGPFDDKHFPQVDAKSLDEWTAFVSAAPLYASGDEFDGRNVAGMYMSDEMSGTEEPHQPMGLMRSRSPSLGSMNDLSGPPAARRTKTSISLSEGTDVMIALGDLSKSRSGNQKRRFGGEQAKGLDSMDARKFFLSPSTSEMQHMFDQQSTLLRSALEAHSTLQQSWLISQQDMLGLGGRGGFSVGEGRLAAELRLANKNLRQRLRNKDKLVDQLTSDHMTLRAEVINLQRELSQTKNHVRELEDRITNKSMIEGRGEGYSENRVTALNGGASATPDRTADVEHVF